MKFKPLIITFTVFILVAATAGPCLAGNDKKLEAKWRNQHQHQTCQIITDYLTGKEQGQLNRSIKELVRLETLLGTCAEDSSIFYLPEVKTDDLQKLPGEILMIYLDKEGVSMSARHFFEGKTIHYLKKKE